MDYIGPPPDRRPRRRSPWTPFTLITLLLFVAMLVVGGIWLTDELRWRRAQRVIDEFRDVPAKAVQPRTPPRAGSPR